jgi:chemotaxis protein MotA
MWQPIEIATIVGCGLGGFFISNNIIVIQMVVSSIMRVLFSSSGKQYTELLIMLNSVLRKIKSRGVVAIEKDIDNPRTSSIFTPYPEFLSRDYAVTFLCDYLRVISLGSINAHEMRESMEEEIEVFEADQHRAVAAVQSLADSLPALGIIAAVLGVINAMNSMSQGPDVLGEMVGSALVGTFLGVTLAYCVCLPLSNAMKSLNESNIHYLGCIKIAMVNAVAGKDPMTCVELARKSLFTEQRPTFHELEEAISNTG